MQFGAPVPQNFKSFSMSSKSLTPGSVYMILNTEFKLDGSLNSIEIFAATEFNLSLQVIMFKKFSSFN